MSARYLLDTDTCNHLRRARNRKLVDRLDALRAGDVAMSVITHGELHRGALRSVDPAASLSILERIVDLVPVLDLPSAAGIHYGRVRTELERAGEVIGGNDLWIAAHAMAANLVLVTGNTREFSQVRGLTIENWATPE